MLAAALLITSLPFVGLAAQKKPAAAAAAEKPKDPAADINTPRPETKKIAFDVSESTWSSVDVSPDGRSLVFDLLGDIYTLPAGGGTATPISRGPAWDHHPRFSPDGKQIAFTSDQNGIENLWIMDADGANRRAITSGKDAYLRSAVWTPDGQYLVSRREDAKLAGIPPVELWMFHRDGGAGIKLVTNDDVQNASGPSVSRDGRFIYFSERKAKFNYVPDMSAGLWQIVRYDRRTGESATLTSGFGGAVRPNVSPDGNTLTFISRRDADTVLVARDLPTGAERVVVAGLTRDDQEDFGTLDMYPNYAFVPDGSSVVLWNHGKLARVSLDTGRIDPIPFKASVEQWLAPTVGFPERLDNSPVTARILRWTSESPDGKWIAFDAFGRIWLQGVDGGKAVGSPRRLTADASTLPAREYAPAFSPDGRSIAYVTWTDSDGGHVWKIDVPATASSAPAVPQKLTRIAGHYANPSWSPSGDRLAVIRGSGLEFRGQQPEDENFFEIRWLPSNGGEPEYVTTVELGQTMKFHPQAFWSSDGTRLYYRKPVDKKKPTDPLQNDLVSVRLDGTDRKAHLRLPAVDDLVPSPDGAWVAFSSRDNVYVAALPPVQAKETPEVSAKDGSVPVWRLSDEAGGYVGWAEHGRTLTWSLGNTFHRLPLEAAIRFAEAQNREAEKKDDTRDKKDTDKPRVPASQSIDIVLTMPRSTPKGSFVLRHARVLTMQRDAGGRDATLDDADIVVNGNRIAAVGPAGTVRVPDGAKEFDARGKTVIPGLVDTHAHLHYSGFEIFPETKWEYVANLAYGVTTVYDPSAPSLDVFAQGEMVEAGLMLGPRVYSSGDVLYGGVNAPQFAEVATFDDAKRQVKRMKAYGARMIKVYQQPRRDVRIWFAEAAREAHMMLTAEGAGELQTDQTMVLDGFSAFEHSLPTQLYGDVVGLLARANTVYTPTLIVSYGGPTAEFYFWQTRNPHDDPKLNRFVPHRTFDRLARRRMYVPPEEYMFPIVARGAADVAHAGGKVTLGAHGQLQGQGAHWELWALAGAGQPNGQSAMTPIEALRAATIVAADKLGFAQDLGSVEAGKLADLVVLDADPLVDITNSARTKWVIKNGELFDAETMREEWPVQRDLPPFFWRERRPTPTSQP